MEADSDRSRRRDPDPVGIRSEWQFRAFGWYLRHYFHRQFRALRASRASLRHLNIPTERPLIIYTNHPSWWDPALFILLSRTLLKRRRGFGPMEESALGRYGLFRRFGIFGIDTTSQRGSARFLQVSLHVLADPGNALWITSEGHFTDARTRPVRLRPGVAHLARRVPGAVLLPMAIEYSFWNERKPEALIRFGEPSEAGRHLDTGRWTNLLESRLTDAMDALARESEARDPLLFQSVLERRGGIGGIYDVWRRLLSLYHGERFDPSHEGPVDPRT